MSILSSLSVDINEFCDGFIEFGSCEVCQICSKTCYNIEVKEMTLSYLCEHITYMSNNSIPIRHLRDIIYPEFRDVVARYNTGYGWRSCDGKIYFKFGIVLVNCFDNNDIIINDVFDTIPLRNFIS